MAYAKAGRTKVGNVWKCDYDVGFDLWYTQKPLPLGASLAMQHGFVKAAKQQDKCVLATMRLRERQGLFVFLDRFQHLSWKAGTDLSCGQESRLLVRMARASVEQVKMAAQG